MGIALSGALHLASHDNIYQLVHHACYYHIMLHSDEMILLLMSPLIMLTHFVLSIAHSPSTQSLMSPPFHLLFAIRFPHSIAHSFTLAVARIIALCVAATITLPSMSLSLFSSLA